MLPLTRTHVLSLFSSFPQTHSIFRSYPHRQLCTSLSPSHMNGGNRGRETPRYSLRNSHTHWTSLQNSSTSLLLNESNWHGTLTKRTLGKESEWKVEGCRVISGSAFVSLLSTVHLAKRHEVTPEDVKMTGEMWTCCRLCWEERGGNARWCDDEFNCCWKFQLHLQPERNSIIHQTRKTRDNWLVVKTAAS